jgi:hypothetical protein
MDSRNGRVPTGDLDSIANLSAKYRASQWRDIGYASPGGFGFIFTNDAKCLRSAIVALHGDCRSELHFAFIVCGLYDLRARPSRSPVTKFALGCGDRRPVVFSNCRLVCSFETAECPVDRSQPFSCDQIWMHRHRSIG